MFYRELFAICDYCGKRLLLPECNSISTNARSILRNNYHWLISRDGSFKCPDCKRIIFN